MEIDSSILISAITLLAAIFSPVIVSIISNCHNTKIRNIEFIQKSKMKYYEDQKQAFEKFLHTTPKLFNTTLYQNQIDPYYENYYGLFMYLPKEYWDELIQFNKTLLNDKNFKDAHTQLQVLSKHMAETLVNTASSLPK